MRLSSDKSQTLQLSPIPDALRHLADMVCRRAPPSPPCGPVETSPSHCALIRLKTDSQFKFIDVFQFRSLFFLHDPCQIWRLESPVISTCPDIPGDSCPRFRTTSRTRPNRRSIPSDPPLEVCLRGDPGSRLERDRIRPSRTAERKGAADRRSGRGTAARQLRLGGKKNSRYRRRLAIEWSAPGAALVTNAPQIRANDYFNPSGRTSPHPRIMFSCW
jgi:hypothetical protein